jgi:hypothetical protein
MATKQKLKGTGRNKLHHDLNVVNMRHSKALVSNDSHFFLAAPCSFVNVIIGN